jgi:hypothetical protein
MGCQIYIKKEAIEKKVKVEPVSIRHSDDYTGHYYSVEGLDFLMHTALDSDYIWHDANTWGSSRKPILELINKNGLVENVDWYEA